LVEDYIMRGFFESGGYRDATGAKYSNLLQRQRELPFGSKLQNHALNQRLNEEFKKYFPMGEYLPILRDKQTHEYWFNENLLVVNLFGQESFNIANVVIEIIDAYIDTKQRAFNSFVVDCERMQVLSAEQPDQAADFIHSLLRPNVDARIFEVVSFAILKTYYADQSIYWGWELDTIEEESLVLYKTGRTNANDGGIDFVMRPLGRFFQVTETVDVKKYFLDIDKVQRFPITFVVKTELSVDEIQSELQRQADIQFPVSQVSEIYMNSIEEIINIPMLSEMLNVSIRQKKLADILERIIVHGKVEFNFSDGLSTDFMMSS